MFCNLNSNVCTIVTNYNLLSIQIDFSYCFIIFEKYRNMNENICYRTYCRSSKFESN